MTTMNYASLNRAQLSYEYLHTNSTTHEFLFGALAELVDNARDANATKLSIFTLFDASLRGNYMLCFLDDGEGMAPAETADIITFGRSSKRSLDDHLIGMYGNGLKSGSMRIGNDLMVFSKKNGTQSCMFLSRSFHEQEKIDEVIVPLPSFKIGSQTPLDNSEQGAERYAMEMDVILRYSPFRTDEDFFAQFDRIEGDSGTLVIVYNMKLLDSGEPELDILTDSSDILLTNPESDFDSDDGLMIERKSFRAYVAILYMDPRMKVYIQGKKVRTKRLASCLYKPKLYKYSSNRFKSRAENDAKKALEEAKAAELRAKEAQSKAKDLESKSGNLTKGQMAELRKANQHAAELKNEAQIKKESSDRKFKALKEPKILPLIFGINIEQRSHDGVFVYNCSRLIKMYEKVGPQADGGVFCSGVVGIVNVPYYVLEPTHNKQDFADAKEYRHLMKVMGEHVTQYWKDLNIAQQGVLKFWESFGYVSQKWKDTPSDDSKFVRKRAMQVNVTLQCDSCLKWRTLPFSSGNIGKDFNDEWTCSHNPESQHNRFSKKCRNVLFVVYVHKLFCKDDKCSSAEQKLNIPEGMYKRESKSQDDKKKDLEEEIKRKQELLEKMHKNRVVTSSREVQEMERKKDAEERKRHEAEEREREEERKKQEAEDRQKRKEHEEKQKRKELEEKRKRKEKDKEVEERRKRKEAEEKERQRRKDLEEKKKKKEQEEQEKQKKKEMEDKRKKKDYEEKAQVKSAAAEEKKPSKRKKVEEEEVEESEVEESPAKRSRRAKKEEVEQSEEEESPSKKSRRAKKEEVEAEATSDDEDSAPRRGRSAAKVSQTPEVNGTPIAKGKQNKSQVKEVSEEEEEDVGFENDMEVEESDVNNSASSEVDSHSDVGTRLEASVNKKWYPGTVVKVNKDGKWKVKFDYNKRDKYDKWFEKNSTSIKLLKSSNTLGSPTQSHQDTANETPSSSTGTGDATQLTESIANGYRTCLRYFLPPQWMMDKDFISGMTPQELATFPLDDFFDHYEKGLRKLVNNFQTEASLRTQEADTANAKLKSVRKMIAKLLTSSNEEFNIDPECDGEQVDEFLLACLQASNSKTSTEGT